MEVNRNPMSALITFARVLYHIISLDRIYIWIRQSWVELLEVFSGDEPSAEWEILGPKTTTMAWNISVLVGLVNNTERVPFGGPIHNASQGFEKRVTSIYQL